MPSEGKQMPNFKWHLCNTIDEMQAFYLSRLPAIREAAREHGYAIGLHGSTRRDFDLIAMPWTKTPSDKETLVRAIHWAACGLYSASYHWTIKPVGRLATSFPICWTEFPGRHDMIGPGHIDLSLMLPVDPAAFAAGAEAMREVAAQVVMDARMGERDSDLRSIIHGIRALPLPTMEPSK